MNGRSRESSRAGYRRRRFLAAGVTLTTAALGGCLGSGGDSESSAPAAVTVPDGATCDVCGMNIRQNPGPNAEIFYGDHSPEGHDNPARFCSTWEAYQYDFDRESDGWEDAAFFVTDYSAVEYEVTEDGGDLVLSSHPEAEAFVAASEVTYVVGSDAVGSMGKDLVAFSEAGDAESFQSEYGGDLATHDEVTPEVIGSL